MVKGVNLYLVRKNIVFVISECGLHTYVINVYSIVIYDVITVDYCKCILLYSPLNSYLYVHWILDF